MTNGGAKPAKRGVFIPKEAGGSRGWTDEKSGDEHLLVPSGPGAKFFPHQPLS